MKSELNVFERQRQERILGSQNVENRYMLNKSFIFRIGIYDCAFYEYYINDIFYVGIGCQVWD